MPKPRRTRFVFSATDRRGELKQGHILAFSRHSARTALEDYHGLRDVTIDILPRAAGLRPRWKVDPVALDKLSAALGVTWKVEVRRTSALDAVGRYRWTPMTILHRVHRVTADKLENPVRASEVIAHELTHAAQTEAAFAAGGMPALVNYYERMERYPYEERPMEIEAQANENLGHLYMPAVWADR